MSREYPMRWLVNDARATSAPFHADLAEELSWSRHVAKCKTRRRRMRHLPLRVVMASARMRLAGRAMRRGAR